MFKTNKSIWGLLYSGSDFLGEAQILHLPTIVEKSKGETIIRGYYGTSLSRKVEVEFSIDFLLDIVSTTAPLEGVKENSVIPPLDITRNRMAVTLFGKEKWVPTRAPALPPLVGNMFTGVIKPEDESLLNMAKG